MRGWVNCAAAVRVLMDRQEKIRESLPPELLAEYRLLEAAVRHANAIIDGRGPGAPAVTPAWLKLPASPP